MSKLDNSQKGVLIHYVAPENKEDLKKEVEEKLPDFIHIFHETTQKVRTEIVKQPESYLNRDRSII